MAAVMAPPSACLVPSSPDRPIKGERYLLLVTASGRHHHQKTADLGHCHWDQLRACQAAFVAPFSGCVAAASVVVAIFARVATRKACAKSDSVVCRYQLFQRLTSYSSSPASPFAISMLSSIAQRLPATRTISASVVSAGPNTM